MSVSTRTADPEPEPVSFDLPDGTTLLALHDGVFRAPARIVRDNEGEPATRMLAASLEGELALDVNVFALRRDEGFVLVDTGGGAALAPALGHARDALDALGIDPANVVAILFTHLHGDHALGLFDDAGALRYGNAAIWCSRIDHDHYGSPAARDAAPEAARPSYDIARRVFDAAGERLRLYDAGDVLLPGIEAIPLPGHTPGHAGFLVGSLTLLTGDVFQLPFAQATRPSAGLVYDADPAVAERTRRDILETGAARSWLVVGAHIPFPGVVTIGPAENGYRFEPFAAA